MKTLLLNITFYTLFISFLPILIVLNKIANKEENK